MYVRLKILKYVGTVINAYNIGFDIQLFIKSAIWPGLEIQKDGRGSPEIVVCVMTVVEFHSVAVEIR